MAFEPKPNRFRAAPVTELLMAENNRVLSVLGPALHELLDLVPGRADETSLLRHPARTAPALVLHLSGLKPMNDSKCTEALSAFSVLIEHSRCLSNYSEAKHVFWLEVLQLRMARVVTRNVPGASLREPTFPTFVVSFYDGLYCTYNVPSSPPFVVPEDAIAAFFSTPPIMPTPTQMQFQPRPDVNGPDAIEIELSFTQCRLTSIDTVEAVERVLNHVFAHPTRQFAVSAMDMSNNSMGPSELAVVARIACKCRHEYQVSKLRLDRIMSGIRSDYRYCDRTPREFLDIVQAAYGIGRSLLSSASTESNTDVVQDVSIRASRLHSVSLSYNDLCPVYFATLFSALRYGNPVHESFSQYNDTLLNNTLCRSWFTFGLFYPRPKRFRKLLGLRNIGDVNCTRDFIEIFTKVLYNPATLLVYGSANHTETGAATELLVCTVKKGASVELIRLGRSQAYRLRSPLLQKCYL
ncbi:hypothetical protein P3T76_007449 [Phytophthora citrophthora]|uniref:Uncharacterized protein n=1 Tax=Phytophthora citrophthora TaxID=4793 RepID=A0AAD9GNW8_9STRA|nr:hypothetical protein P3T76_007449 [Phytophthora citrophthora]